MAKIYGGIHRLSIKYPLLDVSNIRFIAWGAGQWFRDYFPLINFQIEYTVCPVKENQGKIIHGVEVKSPEFLKKENKSNLVILIFSASSNEVTNQILRIGNFYCMPALEFGIDRLSHFTFLEKLNKTIITPPKINISDFEVGFFYQGPIFSYTELALKYQRLRYPNNTHIYVTVEGQNPDLISKCAKWVDDIIQIPPPKIPGLFSRNHMIRTAFEGAKQLLSRGCEFSIRVRSGNIVTGDIDKFIIHNYTNEVAKCNKISFYMGWSWKNVPFHISDAFMACRAKDMVDLWSVAEDIRDPDSFLSEIISSDAHFSKLAYVTTESYIWSHYAGQRGFPNSTLLDYYNFMDQVLFPVDPIMETISLKHIPFFNLMHDNKLSPDLAWWNRFKNNFENEYELGEFRFNSNISVTDYWKNKLG